MTPPSPHSSSANGAGLTPTQPQGAMYIMVRIDLERFPDIKDDVDFFLQLLKEESVGVLPGTHLEGRIENQSLSMVQLRAGPRGARVTGRAV